MARKPLPPEQRVRGTPRKYDLDKEAEDLLRWSANDNALRLYEFTHDKEYLFTDLEAFAKSNNNFAVALIKAKERLALHREQHANDDMIKSHVYNKTAHIYDKEAFETDEHAKDRQLLRQMKLIEHEIKVKKESGMTYDEAMIATQKAILDQLVSAQSALKIANNNISNDDKS